MRIMFAYNYFSNINNKFYLKYSIYNIAMFLSYKVRYLIVQKRRAAKSLGTGCIDKFENAFDCPFFYFIFEFIRW